MSEYFNFGDEFNLNLYSLEFLSENFKLIIFPNHYYYWLEFFRQVEFHQIEYNVAKNSLIKTLAKLQYPDILEENILKIWKHSPNFFSNGYIDNNFEYLESEDRFLKLLRQIKIDKIID